MSITSYVVNRASETEDMGRSSSFSGLTGQGGIFPIVLRVVLFGGFLQDVSDPGPMIMTSVALIRAAAGCPFFRPRSRHASLVMIAVIV